MGDRPDPDALLAQVRQEEERSTRGRLTIFFGSAPGVGKTYAMLESARIEREEGRDVVVGVVETHGRYDTGALLLGLELLPRRKIEYKGVKLEELDLDAALARRPGLILIDELAHSNAPGSRHTKRWQDVEELLESGLDVYSTLNVQHLESLNDVVAQITCVIVKETVPDSVFDSADDVRIIDLPIDQLLERLREGKVYVPEQAVRARQSFFREGNLIALRELALRVTAQRVDAQMRRYREKHGIDRTWAVAERVLVCVSPSPASERLVRGARRLAGSVHADWIAASVETPASLRLSASARQRVTEHLRLARSLGAETVTLSGPRSAEEITRFARSRNVTRIVVGKPTHASWRDRFRASFLEQLVRLTGDIEVHVLTGESAPGSPARAATGEAVRRRLDPAGLIASLVAVALATAFGQLLFGTAQLAEVVMVYLLGIVLVSLRWGLGPSLLAAVLAVVSLDFFFIPPIHTFAVSHESHIVTFAVMFLVAVVISGLTKRVRDQAEAAREREIRTASLYALTGALARAKTTDVVAGAGAKHVSDVFGATARVLVVGAANGSLESPGDGGAWSFDIDEKEHAVAEWTLHNGRPAGAGTDTLPSSTGSYIPLEASASRVGVLAIRLADNAALDHGRRQHLEAFARQIAGALERTHNAERAQQALVRIEAEQLRNSLLSSVSHDLRTPLAVITGTASTLLTAKIEPAMRKELTESILIEAERLNRLVRNLLDMTRLEAGAVAVKKEWQSLEEAIGPALERTERVLGTRSVSTNVPHDLPLVPYDTILLQQVLVNLLENAAKYTPAGTEISVEARSREGEVEIFVADRGPGLSPGEETKIFEKFYRAEKGRGGGVGLGLTICKGIVTAHGGRIWARTRDDGGAAFHFTLPIEGEPPPFEAPESPRRWNEGAESPRHEAKNESPEMTRVPIQILIIEDEPQMQRFLGASLESEGYRTRHAVTGREGLELARTHNPDLILLDLGLPDMDGMAVTRTLREFSRKPIVVISARGQEEDKVRALDVGADDYLTKPFGTAELLARIRVALRHAVRSKEESNEPLLKNGDLEIDLDRRLVLSRGAEVHLTPNEYKLFAYLMKHAGKVLTHRELLKEVWGAAYASQTHYLRVYMVQLRHKLETDPARPRYLLTEPGVGYRLKTAD